MTPSTAAQTVARQVLPEETDNPLNTVLDLVESAVRSAMDLGLEAPLRARMARLLPAPLPAPSDRLSGRESECASKNPAGAVEPPDASEELALVAYQKRFGKFRMTELEYEGWKIIRSFLDEQLDAAKQGRAKA